MLENGKRDESVRKRDNEMVLALFLTGIRIVISCYARNDDVTKLKKDIKRERMHERF